MNIFNRATVVFASVSLLLSVVAPAMASAEKSTSSGGANSFTVLGNAAVTATDATITGDVGTFQAPPTGAVTLTNTPITGTVHVGDAAAVAAFNNFLVQYAALTPKPGDVCTALTGTLDGVTLPPGTYCFDAAATLTGTLTLNGPANGVWIFKVGAGGTGALTGTNFSVVMAGGGDPCNVTWWVRDAVTMTDSNFIGNILAGAAITLTRGTLQGNAWAKADVTITGTAVTGCANVAVPGEDNNKCEDRDMDKHDSDNHVGKSKSDSVHRMETTMCEDKDEHKSDSDRHSSNDGEQGRSSHKGGGK